MSPIALFIVHKAQPGKREEVRRIWERHLQARIAGNDAHAAYFYCFDDSDPDTICVFQLYRDRAGPEHFVAASWYPAYEAEVAPLLAGPSQFRTATPVWLKGAAGEA